MQRDRNLLEAAESEGKLTTVRQASGIRMAGLVGGRATVSERAVAEPRKPCRYNAPPTPIPREGRAPSLG